MTQPLPLFARNQVIVAIWGLVCVLVLSVATGVSSLLWNQRQAELAEQAQQLARIAAGAEVGVNRTLLALDVLLATTEELLGQPLAAGAGSAISEPMADRLLAAVARQSLNVRHVALLDASGRPLASSSAATGRLVDDPPPDFVARALAQRVPTLLIGEPLLAPRSAERVIYLARPVLLPGGQRLLAVAQVPLEALAAVLLQGIGATPIELTLERASGELLLGLATAQGLSDAARASGPPLSDLWEQAANGWHGQTRLRGVPGQVAGRALMYGDLWVTASLAQSEVLRDWQQQVWLVGGAALLLALTLVISGGLAASHIARMQRARAEVAQSKALLDQALASMVSGFVLLDAQHRVVQWNPRFEEFSLAGLGHPARGVVSPGAGGDGALPPARGQRRRKARMGQAADAPPGSTAGHAGAAPAQWPQRANHRAHDARWRAGDRLSRCHRAAPGGGRNRAAGVL